MEAAIINDLASLSASAILFGSASTVVIPQNTTLRGIRCYTNHGNIYPYAGYMADNIHFTAQTLGTTSIKIERVVRLTDERWIDVRFYCF